MIAGLHPLLQSVLGTLLTWGLTALGAAVVFVASSGRSAGLSDRPDQSDRFGRAFLDGSLGAAAGVMTAASYWSLLAPAVTMATESGTYGARGQYAFLPVAVGFLLGASFVLASDHLLQLMGADCTKTLMLGMEMRSKKDDNIVIDWDTGQHGVRWRRILLLILAITVHNIPEGLAVGVGFAGAAQAADPVAAFRSARLLAVGIGLQNLPEGLAVSLPLAAVGFSPLRSFWYGQLSGMVEPVAGVLGCLLVSVVTGLLPYALAFAAGAMIFVVFDDIIPEACRGGNSRVASVSAVGGFALMMVLDVAFVE